MNDIAPLRASLQTLRRWLRLEGEPNASAPAVEAALAEAFQALPGLAPRAGFALRVMALAMAPAVAARRGVPARLPAWLRSAVAAGLTLAGSAWVLAGAAAPAVMAVAGTWLRPGAWIEGAAFVLRETAMLAVRGLATLRALGEVSDALLRVATTPEAAAALAVSSLAAVAAMHALRGVLVAERSV
jgi:hypothetical protein